MDKKIAENVEIVEIKTDFIKLDQLLKWTNLTGSGSEANMFILNGDVEKKSMREILLNLMVKKSRLRCKNRQF